MEILSLFTFHLTIFVDKTYAFLLDNFERTFIALSTYYFGVQLPSSWSLYTNEYVYGFS